jgi:hypothetical protein
VRDGGENLTSNFPFLANITVVVKSGRMKLAGRVARMEEMRVCIKQNVIPIF